MSSAFTRGAPSHVVDYTMLLDERGNPSGIKSNPLYASLMGPLDAFGHVTVASPDALFLNSQLEDACTLMWFTATNGANSDTAYQTNESSTLLRVASGGAAASGDYAIRQSRAVPYFPAHGQRAFLTFTFGAAVTNLTRRAGYFDDDDGLFLEQTSSGVRVVLRTYTSGAAVDTPIEQADWNLDNLDGDDDADNPSGVDLDLQYAQILIVDLQALYVGTVRFGFDLGNGSGVVWCHEEDHQNSQVLPYIRSANLPARFEIRATGAVATVQTLRQICTSITSYGTPKLVGYPRSGGNGATTVAVTTRRPVCSIRPQNKRVPLFPSESHLYTDTRAIFWELVLNGTLGGGGTAWAAVDALAHADVDVGSTTITGGQVIAAGHVEAAASGGGRPGTGQHNIIANRLGVSPASVGDILSLVVTSIPGTATNVSGTIDFLEAY